MFMCINHGSIAGWYPVSICFVEDTETVRVAFFKLNPVNVNLDKILLTIYLSLMFTTSFVPKIAHD